MTNDMGHNPEHYHHFTIKTQKSIDQSRIEKLENENKEMKELLIQVDKRMSNSKIYDGSDFKSKIDKFIYV